MQLIGNKEQAKMYACNTGLILDGFTVEDEHSIVLWEQGRQWYYSRKRPDQRKIVESGEKREHRG